MIFGGIAKKQIKIDPNKYNKKSENLAVAGVIISKIGMILIGGLIYALTGSWG